MLRAQRRLHLHIEMGDTVRDVQTLTLFIGNNRLQLDQFGADPADTLVGTPGHGSMAALMLRPIGTWSLFGLLMRGLIGRLGDAENIDSFSFRRLTVRPRRVKRIKTAIDGEIQWMSTPLVFEVAPEALLLMVPAAADRAEIA